MHAMRAVPFSLVLMTVRDEHRGESAVRNVTPAAILFRADGVPHGWTVKRERESHNDDPSIVGRFIPPRTQMQRENPRVSGGHFLVCS